DPSRDADGAEALQLVLARAPEPRGQRPGPVRDRVARAERVDAALAQGLELLPTVPEQLAAGRLLAHSARPWAHRRWPVMKGSRSPSITGSTLPTSTPVR